MRVIETEQLSMDIYGVGVSVTHVTMQHPTPLLLFDAHTFPFGYAEVVRIA